MRSLATALCLSIIWVVGNSAKNASNFSPDKKPSVTVPELIFVQLTLAHISNPDAERDVLTIDMMETYYWHSDQPNEQYLMNGDKDDYRERKFEPTGTFIANDKSFNIDLIDGSKHLMVRRFKSGLTFVSSTLVWYKDLFTKMILSLVVNFGGCDTAAETLVSLRMTHDIDCTINLANFPFDSHKCRIFVLQYGPQLKGQGLRWVEPDGTIVMDNHGLSQFSITHLEARRCVFEGSEQPVEFESKCLVVEIHVSRGTVFHFLSIYGPSFFIMCVSYVAFWLDPTAVSARTGIGVTSLLSLLTLSLRQTLPSAVVYLTAIDFWNATTQIFAICALMEFAVVNTMHQAMAVDRRRQHETNWFQDPHNWDVGARIVYPICFAIFVLIYFLTVATNQGEELNNDGEYLSNLGFKMGDLPIPKVVAKEFGHVNG